MTMPAQSSTRIIDDTLEKKIREKNFWSIPEAAEFLQCSPDTIRARIKAGRLAWTAPARKYLIPSGALVDCLRSSGK